VPACRYAISDPPADLGTLVNKLQSAIIAYGKEKDIDKTQTQVYFTNRRYYREDNFKSNRNRDRNRPYNRPTPRCVVCKKEGCRSWKHPKKEQEESKNKFFKDMFKDRFHTLPPTIATVSSSRPPSKRHPPYIDLCTRWSST